MPRDAPPAAKPTKHFFDPFNSSATGHQRAENRLSGSISWRDSRSLKLRAQFSAGAGGGKRASDTVGADSLDVGLDGRTENGGWGNGAKGLRKDGQQSLWESVKVEKIVTERPSKRLKTEDKGGRPTSVVDPFTPFRKQDGTITETSWTSHESSTPSFLKPIDPIAVPRPPVSSNPESQKSTKVVEERRAKYPQIFANLAFYINGSTAPISDHKVKHLIATHGGDVSVALRRRTVTHVVIGKPNAHGGCGGGLAASKTQKEIAKLRGCSVKYITADWITESIKAERRLPESRFEAMKLVPKGMASINSMFKPTDTAAGTQ